MWNLKNKQKTKQKYTHRYKQIRVTRGEGFGGMGETAKRGRDGNQTCDGDHLLVYTDDELQCCTPESYVIF